MAAKHFSLTVDGTAEYLEINKKASNKTLHSLPIHL